MWTGWIVYPDKRMILQNVLSMDYASRTYLNRTYPLIPAYSPIVVSLLAIIVNLGGINIDPFQRGPVKLGLY